MEYDSDGVEQKQSFSAVIIGQSSKPVQLKFVNDDVDQMKTFCIESPVQESSKLDLPMDKNLEMSGRRRVRKVLKFTYGG